MKQFYCLLLFVVLTHKLFSQDCGGISGEISPALATICQGSSVELTATGGSSYEWQLNGQVIEGETSNTLKATEGGIYSVIIIEGDCRVPASNFSLVTVLPALSGVIFPANSSICAGSSTTLTATGGTSYTWFRDGVEIGGQTNATLQVSEPGIYSATVRNGDCSAPALNTAEVTSTPSPSGNISPAMAAICQGGSVMLTASGGTSYTWFRNGNQILGQTGETITAVQGGTYSVVIHVGDCSAEASNVAEVTVSATPVGNISPAVSSVCTGGSVELTATGGTTYTWFLNGNEMEGETGATITATEAGTYSAVIHQGDCSAQASNTSVVTITPVPVGAITPAAKTICEGETVRLTATGGTSYAWFKDGTEIEGETRATIDVTGGGTYSAVIKQGTCSGPASNTSVITQTPLPSGTISPASGSICPGGSILLTATGGTTYTWLRNGSIIPGQIDGTYTARQPGTYTVIISQGNCSAPASNSTVISVANAPTGSITPATASFCEGGSTLLTVTGGTSYQWFRNGAEIRGETGSTFNATQPGTYTAIIKQGLCSGPAENSAVIKETKKPTGKISPATATICGGGSVELTATGGTSYAWLLNDVIIEGEQSATLAVTQPGVYSVIIKKDNCENPGSNTVTVTGESSQGIRYPTVFAQPGNGTQLEARNIGKSYEWAPSAGLSNPLSRTPTTTTDSEKEYTVKITTEKGCVIVDTVLVKVSATVFVPTGFTPNGNGKNDLLRPRGALKSIQSFKVFNRWGQLMFQTSQLEAGWDGKFKGMLQPSDAYTWYLIATGADGKPIKLSGKTFLIR
ncbi:MAG: gliding motility-associated C-terminal domain-containing protein [Chitinophagaceae bacterium]|nr:gliding motility-associated C-terminal domain-containing protein [Chitinophagaceae bacterium]